MNNYWHNICILFFTVFSFLRSFFSIHFQFFYLEFLERYSNKKKVFHFNLLFMHSFMTLIRKNFTKKSSWMWGLKKVNPQPQWFYKAKLKIWYHPLFNKYPMSSFQLTFFVSWNHSLFIILWYVWDMLRMGQFNFTWTIPRLYISQIINFIHTYYPSSKVN